MKNNKVLIITTSGGSGHIQAAKAVSEKLREEDRNVQIIQKELFLEWGFKRLCKIGIDIYNRIQRTGKVSSKETMVNMLTLADIFFTPKFVIQLLFYFLKNDFDRVIDTQPVGTNAVIKAIRIYNKIRKKNLILEKVIVDLPTKRTTNFFGNIKKLSKKDRAYIKLISIDPLLEDEKTEEEFWRKHTNMPLKNIVYEKYVIRKAFKKFQNKVLDEKPFNIEIKIGNKKEKEIILKILKKTRTKFLLKDDLLVFTLFRKDKLVTLLLGSQPAIVPTINYVKNFINIMKQGEIKNNCYLFVFCASEPKIYNEIYKLVLKNENFLGKLKLVLMPFQDEYTISSLFFRSNVTITRSGGSTILELLAIAKGKTLIHTESIKRPLDGIPYWEAGNALYLMDRKNARFVSPETLGVVCPLLFR